jgi:hypothetical protein
MFSEGLREEELMDVTFLLYHLGYAPNVKQILSFSFLPVCINSVHY